jgi:hypothetical protein
MVLSLWFLAGALGAAAAAPAPAPRDVALAEEYLKLSRASETYDALVRDGAAQLEAAANDAPCDVVKPVLRERNAEIIAFTRERLGSAHTRERTIAMVQQVFSEAELIEVVGFLRTPLGRTVAEKTPLVGQKMMALVQEGEQDASRKAEELEAKYGAKLDALRTQCEAQMGRDEAREAPAR